MIESIASASSREQQAFRRFRRLRQTPSLRSFVRETDLSCRSFVLPLLIVEGKGVRQEMNAAPGHLLLSIDQLVIEAEELVGLRIPAVVLFARSDKKDDLGSEAYNPDGLIPQAVKALKRHAPQLIVITNVCMCEYTSHGHCGLLKDGAVDNDSTLPFLVRIALSHAEVGADMVAPSDMLDGRIAAIRRGLDAAGFSELPIMSYAAKFASAMYGPFWHAAGSAPRSGDRLAYRIDPSNAREALREIQSDIDEGADIVMVNPALPYLDIINQARREFNVPLAAYNTGGEYAMIKAAARNGWLDEKAATFEVLTAIKRAGADIIISYHAKEVARWLKEGDLVGQ